MRLQVEPATPADLDLASTVYGPVTGDFSSPICRASMPLTPTSPLTSHKLRAEWSCAQQKDCLLHDPAVRMIKAVNPDLPPTDPLHLVALARWSFFESGYRDLGDTPICGTRDRNDPATWPEGLDSKLYCASLDAIYNQRRAWMGEGRYWVLTTIVTREGARKLGAGAMLLRWGIDRAREEGVPVFLESEMATRAWYEGFGFRDVGRTCAEVEGMRIEKIRMRADPK